MSWLLLKTLNLPELLTLTWNSSLPIATLVLSATDQIEDQTKEENWKNVLRLKHTPTHVQENFCLSKKRYNNQFIYHPPNNVTHSLEICDLKAYMASAGSHQVVLHILYACHQDLKSVVNEQWHLIPLHNTGSWQGIVGRHFIMPVHKQDTQECQKIQLKFSSIQSGT